MKNHELYFLVAVNTPFNGSLLTYKASHDMAKNLKPGQLVKVPLGLGSRIAEGCIWECDVAPGIDDLSKIKNIAEITNQIFLSNMECEFYQWMANYYHYPLGLLIFDVLPSLPKKIRVLNFIQGEGQPLDIIMNDEQQKVVAKIIAFGMQSFSKWLVHGVTGAGKTLIYLELIKKIIASGKSVIFLLPEINLTPQFLKTFQTYLDVPIYSYNSTVSNSDKYGLWTLLQEDDSPKMILGVRSSIFLPIKNLGLIIVDEEHDQSFKQDDRCAYNARDLAIKKASLQKIPVVLGSATPMVETYNTFIGTDHYFSLKKRIMDASLPTVELIDMRGRAKIETERAIWPYSNESIQKIKKALEKKEQVLIFINRLGYANFLQCNACGHQFTCQNCSTTLKYFKKRNELSCISCDYKEPRPVMCPECMNLNLSPKGFGTEKAYEVLKEILPERQIERFDRDEIKTFLQLEKVLNRFHQKEIDILVGTQMLSKGHNFKNVNLVIILGIDAQLNFPDFRSNERVFQTLTQVSGRAGRFGQEAEVLVHTLAPMNKIFSYLKDYSFDEFYRDEIPIRKLCSSPPFKKMVLIHFNAKSQAKVMEHSLEAGNSLRALSLKHFDEVEILGPRPSMIEKKVNKFTWSLLVRSANLNQLHNLIRTFTNNTHLPYTVSLKIDVDPYKFD